MKKILITILIILLLILAYFAMFKDLNLSVIKVPSIETIIYEDDILEAEIDKANDLLKRVYPNKQEQLTKSMKELLNKKEEYFSLAKVSTEGEITKANTEETYLIEYLWTRVGRHATSESIKLKMDVKTADAGDPSIKKLSFTAKGRYIDIIQFVSALESDEKLSFKIENFKMVRESDTLVATFNVNNVRIKTETVKGSVDSDTDTNNTAQNTQSTNTQTE